MKNNSMENKMKEMIDSLYTTCLGADGVAPQQQIQAREAIDALRMLCAYQTFDIEATRRENTKLRAMIQVDFHKRNELSPIETKCLSVG